MPNQRFVYAASGRTTRKELRSLLTSQAQR